MIVRKELSYPVVLKTSRLVLRLASPDDEHDCLKIIATTNDEAGGLGGTSRVGLNTIEDVRTKHRLQGPKLELCTKVSSPPEGNIFLAFLKDTDEYIGLISCPFRPEMPYPDLGYAFFRRYWSYGYACEAGRAAVAWWRDVVGVREMWLGTLDNNVRSQKTAERIGFVKAGAIDIVFGQEGVGNGEMWMTATAYVLPGTVWQELDEHGRKRIVRATVGKETDEQRKTEIKFG